ncbi:transmembrane protein 208 [Diorhabda carinulata]|uniref:transmembrane protein 208 n=1 Tax=Diorhabda sublineata TaxID=1163346 RepID=UPI0024E150F0|nr:transmembrane protein 208 [Diorhabda sublineata]XP_057658948.1 transmembrane protein 208 [Diorhabda carinulata]
MAPQQKGKQGTKGAKQIAEENVSTLKFYRNMAVSANAVSLLILYFYNSTISIVLYLFSCLIYIGCYQFMAYMAKPKYTQTGQLLDSGVDLNMEGGIAEHVKDIIILTAGCQLLSSLISNYFWYLWLAVPCRGGWILWKNILQPYFIQPDSGEPEVNEKKQKKLERKMKRMQR